MRLRARWVAALAVSLAATAAAADTITAPLYEQNNNGGTGKHEAVGEFALDRYGKPLTNSGTVLTGSLSAAGVVTGTLKINGVVQSSSATSAFIRGDYRVAIAVTSGTPVFSCQIEDAFDGGTSSWFPETRSDGTIRSYTTAVNTFVYDSEPDVSKRLNCLTLSGGTIMGRVSQ